MSSEMDIVLWEGLRDGEGEVVYESLYLTPNRKDLKYDDGSLYRKVIILGNSGMGLVTHGDGALLHFYPEGQDVGSPKIDDNEAKYASIMCSCLYYLYSEEGRRELSPRNNGEEITFMFTDTDERLFKFMDKLFSKSNVMGLMRDTTEKDASFDNKSLFIDWDGFMNLGESDPLIVFLKKVTNRARGMEITRLGKTTCL